MVWLLVELLPPSSVAVQVRVTEWACGQLPGVVTSANVRVGLESHASVAVGVVNTGDVGHSMVVGPGSAERVGAWVSTTLMVWLLVELLPQSSVAVQVRVRSEEHTSELQSPCNLVCRLLLEKKKKNDKEIYD